MEKKNGFKQFLCSKGGKIGLIVFLYAVIYIIIMLLTTALSNVPFIGLIYGVFFGFFGWKALTKIQPDVFLILPIVGWVIFFVVKLILSIIVGIFVAPYVIGKKITETIQKSL